MSTGNQADSLDELRAEPKHFEASGDFGENPTVIEIKRHLLRRIAELESALSRAAELEAVLHNDKEP